MLLKLSLIIENLVVNQQPGTSNPFRKNGVTVILINTQEWLHCVMTPVEVKNDIFLYWASYQDDVLVCNMYIFPGILERFNFCGVSSITAGGALSSSEVWDFLSFVKPVFMWCIPMNAKHRFWLEGFLCRKIISCKWFLHQWQDKQWWRNCKVSYFLNIIHFFCTSFLYDRIYWMSLL